MARVVLLAMVGARDVQVRYPDRLGFPLEYREQLPTGWVLQSPRSDGKLLWEAYKGNNALSEFIDLPILRACVEHIRIRELTEELLVILFYTNQFKKVGPQYYSNDTLYLAQIAKKWLPDYFRRHDFKVKVWGKVINRRYSPVNSGQMLMFFDDVLPRILPSDSVDWVFTSQTGGIPTVYEALFLQAIRHYRDKCIPLYVLPDGTVFPVDFREFLLEAFCREQVRSLLERHVYASAAILLDYLGLPLAAALCRHATHRLLFDFQQAKTVLDNVIRNLSPILNLDEKNLVNSLREEIRHLQQGLPRPRNPNAVDIWSQRKGQIRACLRELYWGLEIAVHREAWLEVLGRLIRLSEGVFQLAVEETFCQPASDSKEILRIAQRVSQQLYQQLERLPTKTNLNLLRPIAQAQRSRHQWLGLTEDFAQAIRLDNLVELRNKSILWHGFRGVSEKELTSRLGKPVQDVLEDCQAVLKQLQVDLGENPYEKIRSYAFCALNQQ